MISESLHRTLTWIEIALAVVTFVALRFVSAPYGRHARPGWGPRIPVRFGWIVMESPALFGFLAIYMQGQHRLDSAPLALASLWALHYGNRVLVYPLRMRPGNKTMPALIAVLAIVFNLLNASVNAPQLSAFGRYDDGWLGDPRFVLGAALFVTGFVINVRADAALLRLRKPGDTAYRVPTGALHDLVASPNYFGEVLEWTGFAIASWSLAGVAFALYTAANLVPRALTNLAWYRSTFPDYPPKRRAIFPWFLVT